MAVAATLSGLLGGAVAEWLGKGWRGSLLGIPLTYHGVLFLISSGLRLIAVPWLFLLHEPQSRSPAEAMQYVLTTARSRLLTALSTPVRAFQRLGARGGREDNGHAP
jgi:hypothetical protein